MSGPKLLTESEYAKALAKAARKEMRAAKMIFGGKPPGKRKLQSNEVNTAALTCRIVEKYNAGMAASKIAEIEGVSRPYVSILLSRARNQGLTQ